MHARLLPLAALILLALPACLEPPELDELAAPLADLGGLETWGPLDGSPLPVDGDSADGADSEEGESAEPGANTTDGSAGSDSGAPEQPTADPHLAELRLTEVLADPPGKDGGLESPEFVEIQNTGSEPVKLDGLIIDAASWPILDANDLHLVGESLAPGALLVVRRWAGELSESLAELVHDQSNLHTGFVHNDGLRNADGQVALRSAQFNIDELVYGELPDPPPSDWQGPAAQAPSAGWSLCSDPSEHHSAGAWFPCISSPGTIADADPSVTPIVEGDLAIVEVHANPVGPSDDEKENEYIEIVNLSEIELELSNCLVGDAEQFDAPGVDPLHYLTGDGGCVSTTCLAPGRRALIVGQAFVGDPGDALVLATDDSTIADGGLTNTEPVILWSFEGVAITTYRLWPDPSADPLPVDELPLHRMSPDANDAPSSWVAAPASPGH